MAILSSSLIFSALSISLLSNLNLDVVNGVSYTYCDEDYNSSSCANTTLDSAVIYKCRGFLSCKDSTVTNIYDLYCQGDRACKNVIYDNEDDDELWAFGYQSADSLMMANEAQIAYCYGYQACIDLSFADSQNTGNDVYAYGYQSSYSTYIDYADSVSSNGYESLYYAVINTTTVYSNTIDITVYGYYGSYETDIYCQDGITCNFYAYGYYATEETYLYCLAGATCNVYCGDTNGCNGMNLLCYSTATCYFDCDDATVCPNEEDAQASAKLLASYNQEDESVAINEVETKFNNLMKERLQMKQRKQYEFKQERLEQERKELMRIQNIKDEENSIAMRNNIIQSIIMVIGGMIGGMIILTCCNKYSNKNKEYSYQPIV